MNKLLSLNTELNRKTFLSGMEALHFTTPPRLCLELLQALDIHWPNYDAADTRSLETVAAEIDLRSSKAKWKATVGRNPRSNTWEVRFENPELGCFSLRSSIQHTAIVVVEVPDGKLSEPLQKFWDAF
ncbi:MAG: hypothetical protein WCS85_05520 [Candidatus Peribacteraceae bacterium]|jgi:hypothetical protein